ncbi:MAG: hypothetical protein ACKO5K_15990 [Armatimonadota bacterium]
MRLARVFPVLLALAAPAAPAGAQSFSLVYNFLGQPGNQASVAAVASTVPGGMSASDLIRGPGLSVATGSGSFAASGFSTGVWNGADWFGFTVAPTPGHTFSLADLSFSERRSASGIRRWSVRTSLDGFLADIAAGTVPDDTKTRRQWFDFGAVARDVAGPLELRIYGWEAESSAGTWRLGTSSAAGENPDNLLPELRLSGSLSTAGTSAPEPGALLLFAFGLILVKIRKLHHAGVMETP